MWALDKPSTWIIVAALSALILLSNAFIKFVNARRASIFTREQPTFSNFNVKNSINEENNSANSNHRITQDGYYQWPPISQDTEGKWPPIPQNEENDKNN